jgi:hypothetical protein
LEERALSFPELAIASWQPVSNQRPGAMRLFVIVISIADEDVVNVLRAYDEIDDLGTEPDAHEIPVAHPCIRKHAVHAVAPQISEVSEHEATARSRSRQSTSVCIHRTKIHLSPIVDERR